MEYIHLMKDDQHKKIWNHSFANELVRLAQGIGKRFKVTDTIFFVNYKISQVNAAKTLHMNTLW